MQYDESVNAIQIDKSVLSQNDTGAYDVEVAFKNKCGG